MVENAYKKTHVNVPRDSTVYVVNTVSISFSTNSHKRFKRF